MSKQTPDRPLHPNAELRRRLDGSAYWFFPTHRYALTRQGERAEQRIRAKMAVVKHRGWTQQKGEWVKRVAKRDRMTERELMKLASLSNWTTKENLPII